MPAIVEFPTLVQELINAYGDLFVNEPERRHFGEYLTGLLVADRKSVRGINSEFAVTTDQSCLNRWITAVGWEEQQLNARRLQDLQREPSTRYSAQGVIPIDNTLIDHAGELIEDVGKFWDHADQRYLIAHDYLIANYVCASGKHYPLEFRRFRKRAECEADGTPFRDHTALFQELVDWVVAQEIPGDFTFDIYFTHAANLNYIEQHQRTYVGDLKFNRKLIFQGRELKASEVAALIPPEDRKPIDLDGRRQYYFTKTVRIPQVDHRVRLIILWKHQDDVAPRKMLITNRTRWDVTRALRVYRKRWTGTEPFHRDGKQHLGMGDCQLRKGHSQTRPMYLVFLVYSHIITHLQHDRAQEWAAVRLQTVGEACRAALRETLSKTLDWVLQRATDGWTPLQIKTHLALP